MRFGWATRATILAALGAICQVGIFPPFAWTWLTWLAPLPLFLLFPAPRLRAAVAATWLCGTLAAAGVVVPWLWPTMRALFDFGTASTAALLFVVCQFVAGLAFAGLGALLHVARRLRAPARVLFVPAAWVSVEYVRAHVPFGTPWALLGAGLSERSAAVQVADLGGVYALSFVAALASAAVAEVLTVERGHAWQTARGVAVAVVVLGGVFLYGAHRRAEIGALMATAPRAHVAIAHADVPSDRRQGPELALANLERYLALSPVDASGLDLVLWPENAVPVLLEDNPDLVARIGKRATTVPYLVGAPRSVVSGGRATLRASALLIGARGVTAHYDKRRLLPLAETKPSFSGGGLVLARGFTPGAGPPVLDAGTLRLGPLICYEAIFPELTRAAVRAGADLLVNLSDDSWFESDAGPRQHFAFGRLRAVEFRRTLVRASNRGLTAVVLPDGTTAFATDGRSPGLERADVPRLTVPTVYARFGDAFAWMCLCGIGVGLAAGRVWPGNRR